MNKLFQQHMNKSINKIGRTYMDYLQKNFNRGQDGDGNKWQPKSKRTISSYKSKGWNTSKVGVRTGAMKRSMTMQTGIYSKGWTVKYTSLLEYSAYFNDGTENMPARPFIYLQEKKLESIIDTELKTASDKMLKLLKKKIEKI